MSKIRDLFLVDDDEDDQEFFLSVLSEIDSTLTCEVACNGKVALDQLHIRSKNPDMIFLDLNMPVMDGRQFLTVIKQNQKLKDIPVVILSTGSDAATIAASKSLGAAHFMTKPVKLSQLALDVQNFLSNWNTTHNP